MRFPGCVPAMPSVSAFHSIPGIESRLSTIRTVAQRARLRLDTATRSLDLDTARVEELRERAELLEVTIDAAIVQARISGAAEEPALMREATRLAGAAESLGNAVESLIASAGGIPAPRSETGVRKLPVLPVVLGIGAAVAIGLFIATRP